MKNSSKVILVLSVFMAFASGCATSSLSERLTEKVIDRQGVLPVGAGSWRPFIGRSIVGSDEGEGVGVLYPFLWEHGFSERVTLVWMPIPMQARVLAYSDDRQWVTAELALFGPPQSRDRNFEWRPSLDFIWRRKLSAALALDSGFGIHAEVSRTAEKNISRAYIGRIGALWQMLDRVAVLPSVQVMNESGSMKAMYLGEVPVGDGWRVPLGLEIATVLYRDQRRQVELGLQGTWFHLGYENDFTSFPVYLTLAYSW